MHGTPAPSQHKIRPCVHIFECIHVALYSRLWWKWGHVVHGSKLEDMSSSPVNPLVLSLSLLNVNCIFPLPLSTFPFLFTSILPLLPGPAVPVLTLEQRKRCAFFSAATHRSVLTHTQTPPHSDTGEEKLYPPLYQPATLLGCKYECQLPFPSKAASARGTSGILKPGNCFWQIVVFTYCIEST